MNNNNLLASSELTSTRFKVWFNTMRSCKIIPDQKNFGKIIGNESGGAMTQPFISAMLHQASGVSKQTMLGIERHYPFTTRSFFIGNSPMVCLKTLFKWLCKRHELTQGDLVSRLGDLYITEPVLSKFDNHTPLDEWQTVFNFFNDYGYAISADLIRNRERSIGADMPYTTTKSPQVQRVLELYAILKNMGTVKNKQHYAELLGTSASQFSHMNSALKQDLTKDMLVNIATNLPQVSIEWILTGVGNYFRHDAEAMALIIELKKDQVQTRQTLNRLVKHLPKSAIAELGVVRQAL